jgi:hypothetical protein
MWKSVMMTTEFSRMHKKRKINNKQYKDKYLNIYIGALPNECV